MHLLKAVVKGSMRCVAALMFATGRADCRLVRSAQTTLHVETLDVSALIHQLPGRMPPIPENPYSANKCRFRYVIPFFR